VSRLFTSLWNRYPQWLFWHRAHSDKWFFFSASYPANINPCFTVGKCIDVWNRYWSRYWRFCFVMGCCQNATSVPPFFLIVVDQRRSQKRILQRHSRILNFYDVLECDSTFKYGAKDKTWSNCQEPARHSLGPHKSKDELNKIEKNPAPPVTLGPWISGRTNREYDCKKHVNLSWTSCPLFFFLFAPNSAPAPPIAEFGGWPWWPS
jgi:hypothetical protein